MKKFALQKKPLALIYIYTFLNLRRSRKHLYINNQTIKDVKEVYKKLSNWLRKQVQRKGLKYLLIHEYHENGGIHAHALINDCFKLEHSGRYLYNGKAYKADTLQKKGIDINLLKPVYNVPEWKYGFSTAIPVDGNPARLAVT